MRLVASLEGFCDSVVIRSGMLVEAYLVLYPRPSRDSSFVFLLVVCFAVLRFYGAPCEACV